MRVAIAHDLTRPIGNSTSPTTKMVYDWDGKQEECYRLYVQEKRPLDVVMEHFREHYDFAPRYCRPP